MNDISQEFVTPASEKCPWEEHSRKWRGGGALSFAQCGCELHISEAFLAILSYHDYFLAISVNYIILELVRLFEPGFEHC